MKYRIKEIKKYNHHRFLPQRKFLGIFWMTFTSCGDCDIHAHSYEEAMEYINEDKINKNYKKHTIIHNVS